MTTLVVISVALGASAWGLKLFWDNAVSPISEFVQTILKVQPVTLEQLVEKVITPLAIYIGLIIIISVIFHFVYRKTIVKRSITRANEIRDETEQIIEGMMHKAEERIKEVENATNTAYEAMSQAEEQFQELEKQQQKVEQMLITLESNLDKEDSQLE